MNRRWLRARQTPHLQSEGFCSDSKPAHNFTLFHDSNITLISRRFGHLKIRALLRRTRLLCSQRYPRKQASSHTPLGDVFAILLSTAPISLPIRAGSLTLAPQSTQCRVPPVLTTPFCHSSGVAVHRAAELQWRHKPISWELLSHVRRCAAPSSNHRMV